MSPVVPFLAALALVAGQAEPPGQEPVVLRDIRIEGASIYTVEDLQRRFGLVPGRKLAEPVESLADEIQQRYTGDGYAFAEVTAEIDANGALIIRIDEGQIDAVEIRGLPDDLAARLADELAVRPGDVFNRPQALRALDRALEVTHGAVERAVGSPFTMSRDGGRNVLLVHVRSRASRSGVFVGSQEREDWFSPVDGFSPALGFHSTVFDPRLFNHLYYTGYISYKFAADRAGYAVGAERPFFADGVLQVGASLHDLTASDDGWRITDVEQSLVALGFRNTFREYYRRKGYQLHAAVRPLAAHEWLLAWRDDEHLNLINRTDVGIFRDDHEFRPNVEIREGELRALLAGYTFDSRGLARESPGERYRRHQVDNLFGDFTSTDHGVRIDWRSEFAPDGLGHDFDFSRHIVHARTWLELSPGRRVSGRLLAGFSDGVLPPQRLFALGGIGSVRGYRFKEARGDGQLLLNAEFQQRLHGLSGLAFFDAGRVFTPAIDSTDDWLTGVGLGVGFGDHARIEFGWRLDDIPQSFQALFRLSSTF